MAEVIWAEQGQLLSRSSAGRMFEPCSAHQNSLVFSGRF
jgi:hypothetical protein